VVQLPEPRAIWRNSSVNPSSSGSEGESVRPATSAEHGPQRAGISAAL